MQSKMYGAKRAKQNFYLFDFIIFTTIVYTVNQSKCLLILRDNWPFNNNSIFIVIFLQVKPYHSDNEWYGFIVHLVLIGIK